MATRKIRVGTQKDRAHGPRSTLKVLMVLMLLGLGGGVFLFRSGSVVRTGSPPSSGGATDSSVFVLNLETEKIVDQIPGVGSRVCDVIFAL